MASASAQTPSHAELLLPADPTSTPKHKFEFDQFLRREHGFSVDPDRRVCDAYKKGHCPNGDECPDKHYTKANYQNLICKHWLRGLCKKGDHCEFLHEYNLREMPECIQYARYQYCNNGSECLYRHVDPIVKAAPCPHFERGFCPLGPACSQRHDKKSNICPYFLVGFCPDGFDCKRGAHPIWKEKDQLPAPKLKVVLTEEQETARVQQVMIQMDKDDEEESKRYVDRGTYNQQKMQGRGRGGRRARRGRGF